MAEKGEITPLRVFRAPASQQGPLLVAELGVGRLPVRPRPYKGELLSSWLFRLAQGNVQKLHSLTKILVGDKQIWNRDIDALADNELLQALEQSTGVGRDVLRLHTLRSLTGRVYSDFTEKTSTCWILPLGIYHRSRRRRGLMYCPHCLEENPGFLLPWRLSLNVVCPKHEVVLLDTCPKCEAPVVPHRVDMAKHLSKSLPTHSPHTVCFQCGIPLQEATTQQAPQKVVEWQKAVLEAAFGDGLIEVPSVGRIPLLEYLTVARVWLTLLTFGRRAERLRELVGFPLKLKTGVRGRSFDHLDIATRLLAVEYLILLLEDWPDRAVTWSKAARIRRSTLLNDVKEPPEWYLEALRPLEYILILDGLLTKRI